LDLPARGNLRESGERQWVFDAWLGHGATVRGRVVDRATGSPIGGADVWIPLMIQRRAEIELRTRSATDGSFAFEHVPAWGVHAIGTSGWAGMDRALLGSLCASVNGGGRDQLGIDVPEEGETLSFELRLGEVGGVRGRVVDPLGRPIAGVLVTPAGLPSALWWERGDLGAKPVERTLTDEDGRYELRDLLISNGAATTVPINADLECAPGWSAATTNRLVPLEAGRIVDAEDLVLSLPDTTVIRVLDEAGNGVPDAIVQRWRFDGRGRKLRDDPMHSGKTKRCFFVDDGSLRPYPRAPDHGRRGRLRCLERKVELGKTADLTLAPEHHLNGRILADCSRARAGFAVSATGPRRSPPRWFRTSTTRAALRDRVRPVASVRAASSCALEPVLASPPSGDSTERPVVVVANVRDKASDVEIVFHVPPSCSIRHRRKWREPRDTAPCSTTLADSGRRRFVAAARREARRRAGSSLRDRAGSIPVQHVPAGSGICGSTCPAPLARHDPSPSKDRDDPRYPDPGHPRSAQDRGRRSAAVPRSRGPPRVRRWSGSLADEWRRRRLPLPGLVAASRYASGSSAPARRQRETRAAEAVASGARERRDAALLPPESSLRRQQPNRERIVVRVLDAQGRERMVVHPGRYEIEHAECLELGTYTIRVEVEGEPDRERTLTLDPVHRNFVTVWLGGVEVR
jgi:hypothetical protein